MTWDRSPAANLPSPSSTPPPLAGDSVAQELQARQIGGPLDPGSRLSELSQVGSIRHARGEAVRPDSAIFGGAGDSAVPAARHAPEVPASLAPPMTLQRPSLLAMVPQMPPGDPRIPLILRKATRTLQETLYFDERPERRPLLVACLEAARHVARPDPEDLEALADIVGVTRDAALAVEWLQLVDARLTRDQIGARPRLLGAFANELATYDRRLHQEDQDHDYANRAFWTPKASERMVQRHALWLIERLASQGGDASAGVPPQGSVAELARDGLLLAVLRRYSSAVIAHVLKFGCKVESRRPAREAVADEVLDRLKTGMVGFADKLVHLEQAVQLLQALWDHMDRDDKRETLDWLVKAVCYHLGGAVDSRPNAQAVRDLCDFFDRELGPSGPPRLTAMVWAIRRSIPDEAQVSQDRPPTAGPLGSEPP